MRSQTHKTAAAAGALAAVAALITTAPPAPAAGPRDATTDVPADRDVRLSGDTVVTVPPGTTTTGKGTVKGAVTNEGVGAGCRAVSSDHTRRAKGELVLWDKPLKVTGAVRPAADLDLSAAGFDPARETTVLDHTGRAKASGSLTGLQQGAKVRLADTTYRIGYEGGDGNDVGLRAVATPPSPSASGGDAPSSGAVKADPRSANDAAGGLGWWPYVLAVGLLLGLVMPTVRRTRRSRRGGGRHGGGRHAAHG